MFVWCGYEIDVSIHSKYIGVFRYFSKTLYRRNSGDLFDAIDIFFKDPNAVNLVEERS